MFHIDVLQHCTSRQCPPGGGRARESIDVLDVGTLLAGENHAVVASFNHIHDVQDSYLMLRTE
jgi:hypothetical protein